MKIAVGLFEKVRLLHIYHLLVNEIFTKFPPLDYSIHPGRSLLRLIDRRIDRPPMTQATQEFVLTDETLLEQIVAGDAGALEVLYDRHSQTVYSLILRIVSNQAIAEELLQETFWQVWKKADQFGGNGAVAAWLYRIARNKALDQLRRQKVRPQTMESEPEAVEHLTLPAAYGVEAQMERIWNRQHIRLALDQIPDEQRLCLELAYFEGMSQQQIAEYTRTPLGTIKTRVRIGLNKLERLLRAAGYREEDLG